jgi:hypothetical protein
MKNILSNLERMFSNVWPSNKLLVDWEEFIEYQVWAGKALYRDETVPSRALCAYRTIYSVV